MTSFLVDLVLNPADPGYAAVRRNERQPRWYDRPLLIIGCLLVGVTLAVGYVHSNRAAPQAAKVHQALVERVRAAQATGSELESTAAGLGAEVNRQRDAALSGAEALRQQLQRAELLAGTTAVHGPGVVVVLSDPPIASATPSAGPGAAATGQRLTDRDVRSVVNELWAAGAEAMSVNNVRLTPDSAIRFAGLAVLVDFQPLTSPYAIRAIGNADGLITAFADSDVASRYTTLAAARGVGFSFDQSTNLVLPVSPVAVPYYATGPHGAGGGGR
jgi:uncharacterized protein YlxW (UPF0749 family)